MEKYSASEILALRQEDRPFKVRVVELISKATGFYIVGPQESVIFYSKGHVRQKNIYLPINSSKTR